MSLLSIKPVQFPSAPRARMFSVDQISRNGDRFIKRLILDQAQRLELREQRIGLFLEGFLGLETMLGRVLQIGQRWSGNRLIACYSSKLSGGFIYDQMANEGLVPFVKKVPSSWSLGKMIFTSIEALSNFRKEQSDEPVDAVFVLEEECGLFEQALLAGRLKVEDDIAGRQQGGDSVHRGRAVRAGCCDAESACRCT